ncbi:hypothetical protein V2J09_024107 [Rumex salicifolius]
MAGESEKDVDIAEKPDMPAAEKKTKEVTSKKKHRGIISRIWHVLFGSRSDDFERRLERISKEEATILSRMRRRQQSWGKLKRHLILFSVLLEGEILGGPCLIPTRDLFGDLTWDVLIAVGYAVMTATSAENWKKRAFRISNDLTTVWKSYNIRERKDQKSLEKLRDERQAKINELKEKTNYYITQQLIQINAASAFPRYDTDPAAKAAAATVLASKLGADCGLKFTVGDDSKLHDSTAKSNDVELVHQPGGLRNRKQPHSQSDGSGINPVSHHQNAAVLQQMGAEFAEHSQPLHVDHYQNGQSSSNSGGLLARIAALLVGEDPTQSYALICGNCHMHNGLASKEDFPYVTYICPHCHAVNGPRKRDDHVPANEGSIAASSLALDKQAPREVTPDGESNEQHASSDNSVTTKED